MVFLFARAGRRRRRFDFSLLVFLLSLLRKTPEFKIQNSPIRACETHGARRGRRGGEEEQQRRWKQGRRGGRRERTTTETPAELPSSTRRFERPKRRASLRVLCRFACSREGGGVCVRYSWTEERLIDSARAAEAVARAKSEERRGRSKRLGIVL